MRVILVALTFLGITANAATDVRTNGDYLVKFAPNVRPSLQVRGLLPMGTKVHELGLNNWARIKVPSQALRSFNGINIKNLPGVIYVQPNYRIKLYENPSLAAARLKVFGDELGCPEVGMCADAPAAPVPSAEDNPPIPPETAPGQGSDPLFNNQWGMLDIGVTNAWRKSRGARNIVVAVIDTGVDYTHEDLVENLWRNPGESGTDSQGRSKGSNGVDDDGNGYIDDVIGWDVVGNDNKPYDLAKSGMDLFQGGNPGHGTHCAGNVAARGFNGKGVAGVAPNVSIMGIRFLSEDGSGSTAGAIEAVLYAIKNGANVMSNSWGSEGEDPNDPDNQALRDAVTASEQAGILFVAAAGNGRQANQLAPPSGYDNDTDPNPGYPASYPQDIIISVAAIDVNNQLGSFSNYGRQTVDIGAPGVKVYSTTVGSQYSDTVLDMFGMKVTWDGTSMATPHVAGAAALYWSYNPNATWREVKNRIIQTATQIPALSGKVVANGKLNVEALLN